VGLTPDNILNCFISGLHPDIHKDLAILNPYSISQVIGLSKLIEDKIKDSKQRPTQFQTPYTFQSPHISIPTTSHKTTTHLHQRSNMPIKRLTTTQMQERHALRLCYNCDEKFIPGHKCNTSHFSLLLDDLDPLDDPREDTVPTIEASNTIHFHLSSQGLIGNNSPKTLKFTGVIHNLPVTILIDSDNYHNILQPALLTT